MKKKKGFTLIELLIGLILLIILVTGLNMLITYSLKTLKLNELRMEKLPEVNGALEHLRSLDFNDSCLSIGSHSCNVACCGNYTSDIKYKVDSLSPDLIKITVWEKINYNNYNGTITLSVYKGKE